MARPAKLTLWLLLGLVLVLHLAGLEWVARRREGLSLLEAMAPPMYTRLLQQAKPPPVAAEAIVAPAPKPKPRPTVAIKPRPKASEPKEVAQPEPAPEPTPEPQPQVAEALPEPPPYEPGLTDVEMGALAPQAAASAAPVASAASAASAASGAAVPASAPASSAAAIAGATWPADTRLSYQLGGQFRGGPLYGDAQVQWQRNEDRYQVRLDVEVRFLARQTMTSQGEVTPGGLMPRAYEEYRPGKRRTAKFGDEFVTLDNGKTEPRPPGMQDTVSQFVDLAHRFATGRDILEVGRVITVPLGRPGAVDQWTYDVVEKEILRTPKLGAVEAFHLKPRPMANVRGNIYAEMWFAPSLQYLPVRIQVRMGEVDYLDLIVEKIEQ